MKLQIEAPKGEEREKAPPAPHRKILEEEA